MVDRHQPFGPENACGRRRLFRKQRNRHAAGRLTIRAFQNGTVHRQAYRIEWAVGCGNLPPVAVPQRISAVEQAVLAVAQRPGDLHVSDPVDGVRGGCAQRTDLEGIADGSTDYAVEAAIFGKEDALLREVHGNVSPVGIDDGLGIKVIRMLMGDQHRICRAVFVKREERFVRLGVSFRKMIKRVNDHRCGSCRHPNACPGKLLKFHVIHLLCITSKIGITSYEWSITVFL